MALASKTSSKFYVTSGGGGDEINSTRKTNLETAATADSAVGNKQIVDDQTLGPLVLNIQKMQDDLDELRRFVVSASELKAAIGTLPIAGGGTGSTSTTYCDLTANVTGALPNANVAADLTITAGTINNTPIGASTANTIAGTTIDATTDFTIGTTVITDDNIAMDAGSIVMTPSAGDTATIAAAANGVLNITTSDGSGSKEANVTISAEGNVNLNVATSSHHVDTNSIYRGGNVGPISDTFIPVMPVDFISPGSYRNPGQVVVNGHLFAPSTDREVYIAQKIIPKGYTASACIVNGLDADGDARFTCYQGDISGTTPAACSAATAINATATFASAHSNIVGDGEKFCSIIFDPGDAADTIMGAKITIAKT
tara:strand:- start:989 stop:2101 length:1113 start_codon:yes stop_codon:yes gene_type:complete